MSEIIQPITSATPVPLEAKPSTAWSKVCELFQEDNGLLSMTRLLTFLLIAVPLGVWLWLCLVHATLHEMPGSVSDLMYGGLGAKLIAKTTEQGGLFNKPKTTNENPT